MKRRRYVSKNGTLYLSLFGEIYLFHLAIGPLTIAWDVKQ